MKSPEMGRVPENEPSMPNVNRALLAAYKGLLFNDSSDYGSALWDVLKALDPEIAKKLDNHLKNPDKESTIGVELLEELEKRI